MSRGVTSVETSLEGMKDIRSGLDIDLEFKIVTRAGTLPEDQVRIISGGGAGHEPSHAGFVGEGLLTTAITGAIFTSPPVAAILNGIIMSAPSKNASILLIATNYTGDRLNFALAEKMARTRHGYENIRTILVADDVALDDVPETVGNRGLAGTILIHKIAGAMAAQGLTLDEVHSFCENVVNRNLKTIGFSFDVDWPGQKIKNIEIGKGVHGERGAFLLPDSDDFQEIIEFVVRKFKLVLSAGRKDVLVLFNNLGGTTHLFQIFCHEFLKALRFLTIKKVIAGPFFTSLGNTGASVTILELDPEHEQQVINYIEFKSELFSEYFAPAGKTSVIIHQPSATDESQLILPKTRRGVTINGAVFRAILSKVCERIVENRNSLNEMDVEFGDGDTGETLSRGAVAIQSFLTNLKSEEIDLLNYPYEMFKIISHLLSCFMGGSSGALLALFFESAAEALLSDGFQSPLWLHLGNEAVSIAGRSGRGHRTMLDVSMAAQDSLEEKCGLSQLQKNCRAAALATKEMVPKSGRAVYQATNRASKHPDPGAMLVALIVDTIVEIQCAEQVEKN